MSMLVNPFLFATGGGAGPGVADLEFFLDAAQETGFSDGDQMTTAQDFSGNNRDATGVLVSTILPTYRATDGPSGTPAIRLMSNATAQGGYFTVPNFVDAWTEGHGFIVLKLDIEPTLNSRSGHPLGGWGNTTDEYYNFPSDGVIYCGWGSSARKTTLNPVTSLDTWHVYEVRSASGAWSRRINGATSTNDFFSTGTNTVQFRASPGLPTIGRNQTNNNTMHGLVHKVLVYSRVLSAGEITTVYDYLETETGIVMP